MLPEQVALFVFRFEDRLLVPNKGLGFQGVEEGGTFRGRFVAES